MAEGFLEGLNSLLTISDSGENQTENETALNCSEAIDHQTYYVYLLIPSVILTFLFSLTWKRQYRLRNVMKGRPAFVYPMDVMSRSNRFSYAAAFGAIASLCSNVVFDSEYAIDYRGPTYLKVFVALLSMLIYGIAYLPLFTSIAVRTPIGYAIGSLYAWLFLGIKLYAILRCDLRSLSLGLFFVTELAELLCLLYLSISLPFRCGRGIYKTVIQQTSGDPESMEYMVNKIRNSYNGIRVKKLLCMPPKAERPPSTIAGKIFVAIRGVRRKVLYQSSPDFRYSARFLSVTVVSSILIYETTVKLLVGFIPLFIFLKNYGVQVLDVIGYEHSDDETDEITIMRIGLLIMLYFLDAVRICFIVSVSVACVIGLVMVLHSMSSYRNNLLAIYKGNYAHVPLKEARSNASLLVGCMRFAGYQVGYTAWAYIIQFLFCFLITIVLTTIITLFHWGFGNIFIQFLINMWPALLITLFVNILQLLLARFLFLRDSANSLAIDNRRFFFILVYFMFFYNIFLGFISCLLRILKSIVVGALFMARLDQSTLPRRFEFMDPGFASYVGLIYTEKAHTHPVAIVFARLLLAMYYQKLKRKYRVKDTEADEGSEEYKAHRKHMKAKSNWMMLYTLYNNPQLQCFRKDYIDKTKSKFHGFAITEGGITSIKEDTNGKPPLIFTLSREVEKTSVKL